MMLGRGPVRAVAIAGGLTVAGCCSSCSDGSFSLLGNCGTPQVPESECWTPLVSVDRSSCQGRDTEPNDSVPMAMPIAGSCQPSVVQGTLSGNDIDFFHAHADRCAEGKPSLHLGTSQIQACLFVQCSTGSTGSLKDVGLCDDGSMAIHLPSGLLGCCRDRPGDVGLNVLCSTTKKGVDAFVVVDGHDDACTHYDVTFHL